MERNKGAKINLGERLQRGCWAEYRRLVAKVSPEFAAIIDQISPDASHALYLARYNYGEKLIEVGTKFNLPSGAMGVAAFDSGQFDNGVVQDLGYSFMPFAMTIHNCYELYLQDDGYVLPVNIFVPGSVFGIYEILSAICGCNDLAPIWNIGSGLNSVCLMGKASNAGKHRQMCVAYGMNTIPPADLLSQRYTMWQIGRKSGWFSELLIFGKQWLQHVQDIKWARFYNYLFSLAWTQNSNSRNGPRLSKMLLNSKYPQYLSAVAERIIMSAFDYYPGMAVVNNHEELLPAQFLEHAYSEQYQLDYAPVLMGPLFLGDGICHARRVYYSGNYNMADFCYGTQHFNVSNYNILLNFKDLDQLHNLISGLKVCNLLPDNTIMIDGNMRGDRLDCTIRFFYGGTATTTNPKFLASNSLAQYDSELASLMHGRFKGMGLPTLSVFLRSCVQIAV